jgi:hypothetical protein
MPSLSQCPQTPPPSPLLPPSFPPLPPSFPPLQVMLGHTEGSGALDSPGLTRFTAGVEMHHLFMLVPTRPPTRTHLSANTCGLPCAATARAVSTRFCASNPSCFTGSRRHHGPRCDSSGDFAALQRRQHACQELFDVVFRQCLSLWPVQNFRHAAPNLQLPHGFEFIRICSYLPLPSRTLPLSSATCCTRAGETFGVLR